MAKLICIIIIALIVSSGNTFAQTHSVVIDKELMVTDLAVVNHSDEAIKPDGAFHIKTLLDAMAPCGHDAKSILLSIVDSLRTDAPDLPKRRIDEVVINEWNRWKSDGTQIPIGGPLPADTDWAVNWEKAPFRLTAIVNRIDLKENPNIGNAGEERFVFCLVNASDPVDGPSMGFIRSVFEIRTTRSSSHAF